MCVYYVFVFVYHINNYIVLYYVIIHYIYMIFSCNILLYAKAIAILTGTGALRLLPAPRLVRATSQRTFPEKRLTAKSDVAPTAGVVKMWSCEGPVAKKGGGNPNKSPWFNLCIPMLSHDP